MTIKGYYYYYYYLFIAIICFITFRKWSEYDYSCLKIKVFYNHFATIFRTVMSFFTTLDTKRLSLVTHQMQCSSTWLYCKKQNRSDYCTSTLSSTLCCGFGHRFSSTSQWMFSLAKHLGKNLRSWRIQAWHWSAVMSLQAWPGEEWLVHEGAYHEPSISMRRKIPQSG